MGEKPAEPIDVKMFDPDAKDPLTRERGQCLAKDCSVRGPFLTLRECTKRVTAKIHYTAETCHEETVDLMEAIDRCVKNKAFLKIV